MLRVGVTGGIGSGKSTVSRRLAELGATVIDADQVARDVVEPGQPTLVALRERFGATIIREDGSLDRAGLAVIAFTDEDALAALNAITGPAIVRRVANLRAAVPDGAVCVYDMPLLVERGLWVHEHLTLVVQTHTETRRRRLVEHRGLDEADARRRISAQASDEQRAAAADVVLDNNGSPQDLLDAVDLLWRGRLLPYNLNLVEGRRAKRPETNPVVAPRADWEARGARHVARVRAVLGGIEGLDPAAVSVEHIGSTSVPGLIAKDVIDLQVGLPSLATADSAQFRGAMRRAGWLFVEHAGQDNPHPADDDPARWTKRFYGGCDPGDIANLHVREIGSPGWEFALMFRDWLRADPGAVADYAHEKRRLLSLDSSTRAYVDAKEAWFYTARERAVRWAASSGWHAPGS